LERSGGQFVDRNRLLRVRAALRIGRAQCLNRRSSGCRLIFTDDHSKLGATGVALKDEMPSHYQLT
jgi:hypothetical protein